jgi:glycosyltransferase involved in cell wall biosynthesis
VPELLLACAVLSLRNEQGLIEAVRSLLTQDEPVEVVVVNSGGGSAAATLRRAGIEVPVIEPAERLNPGAVRNLGIDATRAPFVSFLAADCLAEPGWTAARLREHRAGALAVASAMTNAYPTNLWAWTEYLALFVRRMPRVPPERRLLYGLSYARELFDRFGRFREDLRTGEDADFNDRISAVASIHWSSEIRTAHRHSRGPIPLVRDQYARGGRMVHTMEALTGTPHRWIVASNALRRILDCVKLSWQAAAPGERPWVVAAWLLLPVAAGAYALGALFSSPANRGLARLPCQPPHDPRPCPPAL